MSPKSATLSVGSGSLAGPLVTAPVRWLKRELCQTQSSEPPESSTGPPAWVHTGLSAMKFFSSKRVTSTEVVSPLFGKVATVVAPTARSATVRFFPATVSAFALEGSPPDDGEAAGAGEVLAEEVGLGEAVVEVEGLALGDGVGVDLATGFTGALLTGFFTGFLTGFLATGFFTALARSPSTRAESAPRSNPIAFLRCESKWMRFMREGYSVNLLVKRYPVENLVDNFDISGG